MTARPTIYDVAAAAHVSHQTVSRVLNGSERVRPVTRMQVEAAIWTLGYERDDLAAALGRRPRRAAQLPQEHPRDNADGTAVR